jgi:ubiquitin-protein ligase
MWAARMQREMADLTRAPPPGVSCFPVDGTSLGHLEAHISGPPGTVYQGGVFKLDVRIPDRCAGAALVAVRGVAECSQ